MAVTPNYSWPIPVATDYVKDGWDAIADLGNAIDSTVYGLGSAGLSQVVPTSIVKGASGSASVSTGGAVTFSGTESISLNGCFNSTYANYLLFMNLSTTSVDNSGIEFRYRASGSDNSSNSYKRGAVEVGLITSYALNSINANTSTVIGLGTTKSTQGYWSKIEIYNPFATDYTKSIATAGGYTLTTGAQIFDGTNSFDGISFYLGGAGTMTGTIRVYGYKNG